MTLASIPDLLSVPQAVTLFERLGYPLYLLPFLGVAKLAGVVGVLVPRLVRIKEWAYAGLAFDLTGALYSHLRVGDSASEWWAAAMGLVLLVGSYAFHYKRTSSSLIPPITSSSLSGDSGWTEGAQASGALGGAYRTARQHDARERPCDHRAALGVEIWSASTPTAISSTSSTTPPLALDVEEYGRRSRRTSGDSLTRDPEAPLFRTRG